MATNLTSSGNFALNIYWLNEAGYASARRIDAADEPLTIRQPLSQLPPGPWRSLGGYLDYSDWPERDRFIELDRAIEAGQGDRPPVHIVPSALRRCRAKIADGANCNAYFTVDEGYDGWKCAAHRASGPCEKPVNSWRERAFSESSDL
jgi:hypothetical protein